MKGRGSGVWSGTKGRGLGGSDRGWKEEKMKQKERKKEKEKEWNGKEREREDNEMKRGRQREKDENCVCLKEWFFLPWRLYCIWLRESIESICVGIEIGEELKAKEGKQINEL